MELMEFAYDQAENVLEEPEYHARFVLAGSGMAAGSFANGMFALVYAGLRDGDKSRPETRTVGGAVFSGKQVQYLDSRYDLDGEYSSWFKLGYTLGGGMTYGAISPSSEDE